MAPNFWSRRGEMNSKKNTEAIKSLIEFNPFIAIVHQSKSCVLTKTLISGKNILIL